MTTRLVNPKGIIPEEEVDIELIHNIFQSAYIEAEIDEDGDMLVSDGGVKVFIKHQEEKKKLSLFSIWGLNDEHSREEKLNALNQVNDDIEMVRCTLTAKNDRMWCDYQYYYNGGLVPFNLIQVYRRFATILKALPGFEPIQDMI